MFDLISSLFFPILTLILHIGIIALCIYVALKLQSIGEKKFEVIGLSQAECVCDGPALNYTNGGSCSPQIFNDNCHEKSTNRNQCIKAFCKYNGIQTPKYTIILHVRIILFHNFVKINKFILFLKIVSVIIALWTYKLITAFGEMVLAHAFATWYFIPDKVFLPFFTLIHGVHLTVRYHVGTLAFGSFILTVCSIIKTLIDAISNNMQASGEGGIFAQVCMCCCQGIVAALKDLLKYINKNAYIMCSIYGKNFIGSARDAVNLLVSSALHAYTLTYISKFLLFIIKFLIALLMSLITYLIYTSTSNVYLQYKLLPAVLVGFGTYMVAKIFFDVYAMAVDTLFVCVLDDVDNNDGSPEKPYSMSEFMQALLQDNGFNVGKVTEV